ncbi:MAG: flagellar basal body rod protein FlgB [Chromatiales bacterium]|nr:flagellar basal body rod protein FlgB [Chromatiales bacterium]
MDIAKVFATHTRSLALSQQRLSLLAGNLANADTPGFRARDIDFRSAMQDAGTNQLRLTTSRSGHMDATTGSALLAEVRYRPAEQPSMDGNTVDTQRESAAVAETAVRYQATLTFLNARIQGLRAAITGGRG